MFDPNEFGGMDLPPGFASQQGQTSPYSGGRDIHVLDRLSSLYKYRRIVVTVALLVIIAGLVQTYTTIPMYRATARVQIEEEQAEAMGFRSDGYVYQDPEPFYNTQYRILQGRDLARAIVGQLNLKEVPEFNPKALQSGGLAESLQSMRAKVTSQIKSLIGGAEKQEGTAVPAKNTEPDEDAYVDAFLGRVQIVPQRNTHLVDVSFVSSTAVFAARAANALAEGYVTQNLDLKLRNTDKTLAWLTTELNTQRKKVEDTEKALSDYREQQNALSLEDRQNIVVSQLNQLSDAYTRAKTTRIEKESLYRQVQNIGNDAAAAESLPVILANGYIQTLRGQIAELEKERIRLSERYGEKHPDIVNADKRIAEVQRQYRTQVVNLIDSIKNEYESAHAQEVSLAAQLEQQKFASMELNRKGAGYTVLEREAKSNREVYETLLQREKELSVARNSRANNVRLMDRAEVPKAPFSPNPRRDLLLSVALGIALGLGLAFVLEYLDDTIKTPEDITRKLKLPFLGLVPAVRGERTPLLLGPVPHDFGEAFRALRTSLVFSSDGAPTRVIAVTSAQPLEGKTTTACNLAIALALGGARVLLVDADLRRPELHRTLGMKNTAGLSHLLVGQARARDAIQHTSDPNLWVLTAGRTPPNPSELLASDRMKNLIGSLASGPFDWVIIDTPPVLAVTDAVIIAPMVLGVVFVLGAEMTRRRLAERAIETIMAAKPRVLGAVLNRVDFNRNKYYYSRYYGHQYKSYYEQATASA